MLKNHFKIGWRNLLKNKGYAVINIGGLAVGMSVAMLIGLWIYDEWSFDKTFPRYDRIAQVIQNVTNNGAVQTWTSVPSPLGDALRKDFGDDFKHVVMSAGPYDHLLSYKETTFNKTGIYFEPGGPEMLSLEMIKGSRSGLEDPSSILISQSLAESYFGADDPMGKVMKLDNNDVLKVTGVFKDLPVNSTLGETQFIIPWALLANNSGFKTNPNPWRCNCYEAYVELADQAEMEAVSFKIKDIKMKNVRQEELIHKPQLFLHPMSRWHLYSKFKDGINAGGRIQYVRLFAIIGAFVLLLACINFMNLSTARSEKRAKEVGIRKTIGSLRGQLVYQFFVESLLVVAFGFLLSLVLVQLSLPFFNLVAEKKMQLLWDRPSFWIMGVGFSLITGLLAGSYPSMYLSSFMPVRALKGSGGIGRTASMPRKVLVVLQFTVSISLIIGTIAVFRQIQYTKYRPTGYDREGLMAMYMGSSDIHKHFDVVKAELLQAGAITDMAESASALTQVWSTNSGFNWNGKDPELAVDFPNTGVSWDFGKTVGWQFLEGRDFSREYPSDSSAFILNETAAKYMGLKEPIGQVVTWDETPYHVIGVIRDVVTESPYKPVRPSIYRLNTGPGNMVVARINPNHDASDDVAKVKEVFTRQNPSEPFAYQWVDEEYARKFNNEERVGKLSACFAVLAIFISCLGLYGMASFVAEQRTKEMGIRKVLGASVSNLWQMLSKDFVLLVIISCVVAIPLSWYFINGWLEQYDYRTTVSWYIFAFAAVGALIITLLTVSFQAIKAATANPVNSLKTE